MFKDMSETRRIALLGVLSGIGAALMYIEIPITFFNFLRIDLSDVVVVMTLMILGFKEAIVVAFVKSFVHFLFPGTNATFGIGEAAAFIASASYVIGFYLANIKLKLNKIYSSVISIIFMSSVMTVLNWIIIFPLYYIVIYNDSYPNLLNGVYINTILTVFLPFNLIKGGVIFSVFLALERSLEEIIKKNS